MTNSCNFYNCLFENVQYQGLQRRQTSMGRVGARQEMRGVFYCEGAPHVLCVTFTSSSRWLLLERYASPLLRALSLFGESVFIVSVSGVLERVAIATGTR